MVEVIVLSILKNKFDAAVKAIKAVIKHWVTKAKLVIPILILVSDFE